LKKCEALLQGGSFLFFCQVLRSAKGFDSSIQVSRWFPKNVHVKLPLPPPPKPCAPSPWEKLLSEGKYESLEAGSIHPSDGSAPVFPLTFLGRTLSPSLPRRAAVKESRELLVFDMKMSSITMELKMLREQGIINSRDVQLDVRQLSVLGKTFEHSPGRLTED